MNDCISRQAVLDLFQDNVSTLHNYARVWEAVEELPSVTPTERTGHWIEKEDFNGDTYYDCSECGESFCLIDGTPTDNLYNYCPNCGCRMQESEEV